MSWAWRIGSALALALGGPLAGPLCAQQPLTLEDYALSLEEVQRLVEQGRLVEAQTAARGLRHRGVAWDDETLTPDASALDAVLEARSAAEAARAARRLGRLAGALRLPPQAAAPPVAEPDILERITPVDPLKRGGAVASLRVKPLTLLERVEAAPPAPCTATMCSKWWRASAARTACSWWPTRCTASSSTTGGRRRAC